VSDWTGTSTASVPALVEALRDGAGARLNRLFARKASQEWSQIPTQNAGVFDGIETAPAWSARYTFTSGDGRGIAHCDVRIFDRGNEREVLVDSGYTFGLKPRAKEMLRGISEAVGHA
jgi:hypothetical protein